MKTLLSAGMMALFAMTAHAADVVSSITPMALKVHLEGQGYTVFAHEDENDQPQLLVTPKDAPAMMSEDERKGFAMRLTGCQPQDAAFYDRACEGYTFHAYLTPGFPIADKVYADWNSDIGRTRAFIKDGHPRLEWHVTVEGGVTWPHVDATVRTWRRELRGFLDHLDASLLD